MPFVPNPIPLSTSEEIDQLKRNQGELLRAHNELVDNFTKLSKRMADALVLLSATLPDEPAEMPQREPFKRHGKRH